MILLSIYSSFPQKRKINKKNTWTELVQMVLPSEYVDLEREGERSIRILGWSTENVDFVFST